MTTHCTRAYHAGMSTEININDVPHSMRTLVAALAARGCPVYDVSDGSGFITGAPCDSRRVITIELNALSQSTLCDDDEDYSNYELMELLVGVIPGCQVRQYDDPDVLLVYPDGDAVMPEWWHSEVAVLRTAVSLRPSLAGPVLIALDVLTTLALSNCIILHADADPLCSEKVALLYVTFADDRKVRVRANGVIVYIRPNPRTDGISVSCLVTAGALALQVEAYRSNGTKS